MQYRDLILAITGHNILNSQILFLKDIEVMENFILFVTVYTSAFSMCLILLINLILYDHNILLLFTKINISIFRKCYCSLIHELEIAV